MQFMKPHEPSKYPYINAAGTPTHSYRPKMTNTIKKIITPTEDNSRRPYLHILVNHAC